MASPIWITEQTNLGIIQHGVEFTKSVTARNADLYEIVSGELPTGAILNPLNGVIYGLVFDQFPGTNFPIKRYIFTVRASNTAGEYTNRTFTLNLVLYELLLPDSGFNQYKILYLPNTISYQLSRGNVDTSNGVYWRLDAGNMPDGATLYQNGNIEVTHNHEVYPFFVESFKRPTVEILPESVYASWDEFAKQTLSSASNNDYQFIISLRDNSNPIEFSVTVRITYLRFIGNESWFRENSEYVTVDTGRVFVFMTVSEADFIEWKSDSVLPSLGNGSISDLEIKASCITGKAVKYALKPEVASNLPLGLEFTNSGLLVGRVSFRTYVDDPVNLPVDDNYTFTVRAKSVDNFTFVEKKFTLHIDRIHNEPYVNIWVRSFPIIENRQQLDELLSNRIFFPERLVYRPEDPWFGKLKELRFLFAPGLKAKTFEEYYQALANNHYLKTLLLGEVKTAVAYDNSLNIKYEVVYIPVVDNFSATTENGLNVGLADTIDLRNQIQNFYWVNNTPVYNFHPNGLENMRRQLEQFIGYYNQGILPLWMTSPQPIPKQVGQFYTPIGFQQAIVLCYTVPGGSEPIAYRLRRAKVNFNDFRFEFDRYELDDNLTKSYDTTAGLFVDGEETIFDDGTTIFEESTTRFNRLSEFVGGQGPGVDNKYLKFPKTGAFK